MSKSSTGFKSSAIRKTPMGASTTDSGNATSLGVTGTRTGSANKQRSTGSSFNKKAKMSASQMLEAENKKMEEKLKLVQNMMQQEKSAREGGNMWRSANTKDGLRGYGDKALNRQTQNARLPPQQVPQQNQIRNVQKAGDPGFMAGIPPPLPKQNVIQNNLQNALRQQQEEEANEMAASSRPGGAIQQPGASATGSQREYPEVDEFLGSITLQKYYEMFAENGIEDLETILELNDTHLDAMAVPLGHKLKILKRIKTVRQEKGMTVPESRQGGARPKAPEVDPTNNVSTGRRAVTNNDYEELPAPEDVKPPKAILKQAVPEQKPVATNDSAPMKSDKLLDGAFDEGESHNSFLEALNAWRGVPNKDDKENKAKKGVRFQGDNQQKKGPGSFFANINQNDTNFSLPEGVSFADGGTKPDYELQDAKFGPKESCWQCYKLFPRDEACVAQGADKKQFCSKLCLGKFEVENMISCQVTGEKTCSNKFLKTVGSFALGKWFCSDECLEADEELKEIEKQKQQQDFDDSSDVEIDL